MPQMNRPTGITKDDNHARQCWGEAFDAIPKSVFAVLAWHLANAASGECDASGAAEARALEEINALVGAEIIPARQGKAARAALSRLAVAS